MKKNGFAPLIIILVIAILVFGVGVLYLTNQKKVVTQPKVTTPLPNSIIKSPLVVKGSVPSGWMFEGTFPIELVDANRKTISDGIGHDVPSGAWQEDKPVDFEATLTFTTLSKSGYLILRNDNPSGILENSKTFEIPIKF